MNALTAARAGVTEHMPADLEGKLVWLTKFGKPSVRRMDKGWYCGIEMHVASIGSRFDVKSDFDHASPAIAVDELIRRMLAALAMLAKP